MTGTVAPTGKAPPPWLVPTAVALGLIFIGIVVLAVVVTRRMRARKEKGYALRRAYVEAVSANTAKRANLKRDLVRRRTQANNVLNRTRNLHDIAGNFLKDVPRPRTRRTDNLWFNEPEPPWLRNAPPNVFRDKMATRIQARARARMQRR